MARASFFNIPFHGHVNVTLPFVAELVRRGDEVTYYATDEFAARISAAGATLRAYEPAHAFAQTRTDSHALSLGALVARTTRSVMPQVESDLAARTPDYLIFDMSAPWGALASRRHGIPAVASFPHLPFSWRALLDDRRVLARALEAIRPGAGHWRRAVAETRRTVAALGLRRPRDINLLSSAAELNIVFSSRYFQPHADRFDGSYLFVGPSVDLGRPEEPLAIERRPGQRLVYIAVGTVYRADVGFFCACMAALGGDPPAGPAAGDATPHAVVMSIGRGVERAALGPIPANFTVAHHVPQISVLKQADVFITHGGMNSISEAVTLGVPMIVVPNTVEQVMNSSRVEALGAGLFVPREEATAERVSAAVRRVLSDERHRHGAQQIARSFAAAGGVARAADAVDALKNRRGR